MYGLEALSIVQLILSSSVFVGIIVMISGILHSKTARVQPFNVYLVVMQFVDAIMNLMYIVIYVYFWVTKPDISPTGTDEELRHAQTFWIVASSITIFATFVNMYLSAIVAYHIYRLLQCSYRAIRIKPPTIRRVLFESGIVYFCGIACAVGYCVTAIVARDIHFEERTDGFIWGWYLFGFLIVPFLYIIFIAIRIWRRKLLSVSNNSRTRCIAIYFGRIVFVFVLFYIPGTILFALGLTRLNNDTWSRHMGPILMTLQGAFSMAVALTKDDIREAVVDLLRCDSSSKWEEGEHVNNKNDAASVDVENTKVEANDSNDVHDAQNDITHSTRSFADKSSPHEEQQPPNS